MRILLLSDWYHPAVNGVVVSVENLRKGLLALGHDVRLMTLSQDRRSYYEDGIYWIGSHDAGLIYPGARLRSPAATAFSDELAYWAPDILHTNCEFSTFYIALHLKKLFGIPLIHTYHTMYEDYTQYFSPSKAMGKAAVRFYTRFVSERIDGIIAPTEKVRTLLEEYAISCPIFVIPSGIDLSRYAEPLSDDERRAVRSRYGIGDDEVLFIFCGRLAAEKNVETILRIFRRRKGRRLLVVGDGPVRKTLEALRDGLGSDAVFTGMLPPDEVSRCYRASDAFISASRSETQGLTFIEALASALPVIAFRDPVLCGVVEDGLNGLLADDDEELAKAVERLDGDEGLRRSMATQARRGAHAFGIEAFASKVADLYAEARTDTRT